MPAYLLLLMYAGIALLFPDRWNYLLGLVLALVLYLGSWRLGRFIASNPLSLKDEILFFPLGFGILLFVTYVVAVISTGFVLYCFWILAAILAFFEKEIVFRRLSIRLLWVLPFIGLGICSSLTPSTFFDTLVYHLGLPMQDLIAGKMKTFSYHLFSTFPPFEMVQNLLFVKLNALSGIKVFSILIVLHIIYLLRNLTGTLLNEESGQPLESIFVVLPVCFLPSIWIQIHLVTADLLVALFLLSAITYMIKNRLTMEYNQLTCAAILAACAVWTKPTALPYLALMCSLWIPLRFLKLDLKKFIYFYGLIFLFISPLLVRNYAIAGDPLYPAMSRVLKNPNWSHEQQLALDVDISAPKKGRFVRFFKAPIEIIYAPYKYGSAAEIGIFYFLGLIGYSFFWRKHPSANRLMVFLFFCYIAWGFLFRDFRQFFPVFLLIHVLCAVALHDIFAYRKWLPAVCLGLSAIFSVYLLLPVFGRHLPLVRFNQNQKMYLKENVDYYSLAEWSQSLPKTGKMLLLGETKIAYLEVPVFSTTAFDKHPFFAWLSQSSNSKDLYDQFAKFNIKYMMVNWQEYARFAEKCGILPIDPVPQRFRNIFKKGKARTGVSLAHLKKREAQVLAEFSSNCLVPKWRMSDYVFVWEVRCTEDLPQSSMSPQN